MGRDHKKVRMLLLAFAAYVAVTLTGCAAGDSTAAGSGNVEGALSRAEYIGMLGDSFGYDTYLSETDIFSDVPSSNKYYDQIQAAAEWQIIDSGKAFEPDGMASVGFALESAVRAVGTEDIAASGAAIDLNRLAEFYVGNIAQVDLSDSDTPIDADAARQIIAYAKSYDAGLALPQITEVQLAEGVKTADMDLWLNADGATGVLSGTTGYKVGDIVYLEATDTSLARAIKITGIEGGRFTFEDASVEEAYAYLNIRGTFEGKIVEAVSESDGTDVNMGRDIYDQMKAYDMAVTESEQEIVRLANSAKVDASGDHMVFTAKFDVQKSTAGKGASANAASNGQLVIGIRNIKVDVNYESSAWYKPLDPKIIEFRLHFDSEVSSEIHGSASASIPLGEAYIQVWGPLNIKVMLTAHVGADGNVSVSYTTKNVMTVGWRKGTGLGRSFDSQADADFEADATLTAEATLLADLRIGFKTVSCSVVNAQVTCGAVAAARVEADLLGDQPTCVDLQLYVPLKWGVNQSGCIITDINSKWKYSGVIWDSGNSPVKLHLHLEDWQRVAGDICTRKEAVKQELVTPEGLPLEEIDPFDFEPVDFDFIELISYSMYLGKGESQNIGYASVPEGYLQSDLRYEVMDSNVCSVSGGTVRANNAGSTMVKISTGDGMFTVRLAVTVNEDYTVEGFQSL